MDLAARQHGVVALWQASTVGMGSKSGWVRLTTGSWTRLSDQVFQRTGSHVGRAQAAMAGVLDSGPGAVLADASGAAWWRVPGPQLQPVHVVRQSRSHRTGGLAVTSTVRHLPDHWVTELDGRRGRNGTAALRDYLAPRGTGYVPPASNTESRAKQVLGRAGIAVECQVDTGDDAHWTGRVDFRVSGSSVLFEVQSEFHHTALVDLDADRKRLEGLRAAGFVVVEATDAEVFHHADVVIRRVRNAIRVASRSDP